MKPVLQTLDGPRGDCFLACLASILELPLGELPDFQALLPGFSEGPQAWGARFLSGVNGWLATFGLAYFELNTAPDSLPDPVLDSLVLSGVFWIGLLEADTGPWHAVVMRGRLVAHGPLPERKKPPGERLVGAGVLLAVVPRG